MKFANNFLFTTLFLIITVQFGCVSLNQTHRAEKLVNAKDYSGAIEVYQSIVESHPGTVNARKAQLAIGKLYIEHLNQPEKGIDAYEAIIAEAPTSDESAEARYRIGTHTYNKEKYDTAQIYFEIIVNQFSHLKLIHNAQIMLAKSYEAGEKFEQAVETYENLMTRYPYSKRTPQILTYKARIQREHFNDDEEAIRTLELLVRKYNKNEDAESYVSEAKKTLIEFNRSPFGFGPYPEIPADFPFREGILGWDSPTPEHELAYRVHIKLWEQGTQLTSVSISGNGLIYPGMPGVIYVEWTTLPDNDPEFPGQRYASHISGHPETAKKWQSLYLVNRSYERTGVTPNEIEESGIKVHVYPDGTKVYPFPDAGIDPYEFLGLTK